jgi:hypothetical protein
MPSREQVSPLDLSLSRRRMLGLTALGGGALALAAERRLPQDQSKELEQSLEAAIPNYEPSVDIEATGQKLSNLASSLKRPTHEQLFRATADTFAATMVAGGYNWKGADDAYIRTDSHGIFVNYYRRENSNSPYAETASSLDLVLGVRQLVLERQKILIGFQFRIIFSYGKQGF